MAVCLGTDLDSICQAFVEASESNVSMCVELSCFEEVQQATATELKRDSPSNPAVALVYRSGLSENGLSLTIRSQEQCSLLTCVVLRMLSHLLKMCPGLSLAAQNRRVSCILLDLLRVEDVQLQLSVLDVIATLLDISYWTYDFPLDAAFERLSLLAQGYHLSDDCELTKAQWQSSILAVLQKLVPLKVSDFLFYKFLPVAFVVLKHKKQPRIPVHRHLCVGCHYFSGMRVRSAK